MQQKNNHAPSLRVWGGKPRVKWSERLLDLLQHIIVLGAFLMFVSFVQVAVAAVPQEATREGTLYYRAAHDGQYRIAPVMKTDIDMRVTGFINRAHITQTFSNASDDWVEGVYVFPLPEDAAVDRLRIRIGERIIEGQIKERAQARQIYAQARREGKRASLVEQERPNMFTTSVANIGPREQVHIEIEFQHTLTFDNGEFRLRLPLAITPRYILGNVTDAPAHGQQNGTGSARPTDQVPDADRITPLVTAGQKINPVSLHIELDAGFALSNLSSTYHAIITNSHGEGRFTITLAQNTVPAERDFELVWAPEAGQAPRTALFHEQLGDEHFYLGMVLPPQDDDVQEQTLAREIIYVIDTSGSMGGVSIRQARTALLLAVKRLHAGDYFNIIQFNSYTSALFETPQPVNLINKTLASRYVMNLEATGGTEMLGAMQAALQVHDDQPRLRQVIFLTDGAIGNESELFEYINRHLGASRLFTVGIGSAPNSHFMRKAAQFGRGTYTYIGKVNEVAEKMQALFGRLDSPLMRDVGILHALDEFEMWPRRLPDLYAGEPLLFTVRTRAQSGAITLQGQRNAAPWHDSLDLQQAHAGTGIAQLWARSKIEALLDSVHDGADAQAVRQAVIGVALRHHMVSKHTSLVAVDVTPVRPATAPLHARAVPVNLPHGQDAAKIFGLQAQTGTAQNLLWLLGVLCLTTAVLLRTITQRRTRSCA